MYDTTRTDYLNMHRANHHQAVGLCAECQTLHPLLADSQTHIDRLNAEIAEDGESELFYHPHFEKSYCWHCYPEADEQGRCLRM